PRFHPEDTASHASALSGPVLKDRPRSLYYGIHPALSTLQALSHILSNNGRYCSPCDQRLLNSTTRINPRGLFASIAFSVHKGCTHMQKRVLVKPPGF